MCAPQAFTTIIALLKLMHLDTRCSNHTLLIPMNQCFLSLSGFSLLRGWGYKNEKTR